MAALGGTAFAGDTLEDDDFVNQGADEGIPAEETAAPTEEVAEVETAAEPEVTTDKARDPETGKFVKKEATTDEAPAEAPAATTPPVAEAATPEAPAAPVVEEVAEPFVFRVSGKDFTLEGAKITKDGMHVPLEQIANVKAAIAEGVYAKQTWRETEQANIKKGYDKALAESPEIRQAKAYMAALGPLLSDPDVAAQFLSDFHTNAPILRANAEAAMVREELEALKTGQKQQLESGQQEQMEQARETLLSQTMDELRSVPDTKILTKDDWATIDRQVALLKQRNALFVEREGDTYLDVPVIEEIAQYVVNVRKEAIATAKKAEDALKFNAGNKPKPVPARTGSAAVAPRTGGAPKAAAPVVDSRDVVNDFMAGRLDEED